MQTEPSEPSKKVLILSPYDAMSHRYWREGLAQYLTEYEFTVVALPARFFAWRHRGNSLSLAHDERLSADFDLVIATSMTDLSALRGLRPALASIPTVLYFHENQFAYPDSENARSGQVERQITSIYSALAADQLVFNSAYNQTTFLDGAKALLKRMPDHVPRGIVETLTAMSTVMPVPLDETLFTRQPPRSGELSIVWNHRWEYDKGLSELQHIVEGLISSDLQFRFHLIGQQFRKTPEVMSQIVSALRKADRLGTCGFVESRADYLSLLGQSHVVLSTAQHEFQGLAVLEGVACGCVPLVPNRLVYPELFSFEYCYQDAQEVVHRLGLMSKATLLAPDVSHLSWGKQRDAWRQLLQASLLTNLLNSPGMV